MNNHIKTGSLKWSTYFQNPKFLEMTRKFLIDDLLKPALLHYCGIEKGTTFLDVGCGTGYLTRFLWGDAGVSAVGIDSEREFVEAANVIAREKGYDISFVCGDALKLPFEDNSFDAVVSLTFLSSVSEPRRALDEMQRVCKPDGRISSITPMSIENMASHPGNYPPSNKWRNKLIALEARAWKMYEAIAPVKSYLNALPLTEIPRFFSESLSDVTIFPIGKAFSLSNAAYSLSDKREYINCMCESKIEKFENFMQLKGSGAYFSKEQHAEYVDLLYAERDFLLSNNGENGIWQWEGGANLLVSGRNSKNSGTERTVAFVNKADYDKFKECGPEDTYAKIIEILDRNGIKTKNEWIPREVSGCFSNRVSIEGTIFGTNGKGTSEAFSLASGYAELMERLQNQMYYLGNYSDEDFRYREIIKWPDAETVTASVVAESDTAFTREFFGKLGANGYFDKLRAVNLWNCGYDKMPMAPFVSLKDNRVVHLPMLLVEKVYGSNGMCAGNTMEEALVQGMAEVFERMANRAVILDKITPPTVPDEFLIQYESLWRSIEEIRGKGAYDVIVKDCSLGKGLPVVASIIVNKNTGRFGIKFASHPSFAVAVERTLTEAFQGKSLRLATSMNTIGTDESVRNAENIMNTMKTGVGAYPKELFYKKPSYEFTPFKDVTDKTNVELLDWEFGIILGEGKDILIRDVSFLGFHSYFIIVPGLSELYEITDLRGRTIMTGSLIEAGVPRMRNLQTDEVERLARYIQLKYYSELENSINVILGRPFVKPLPGGNAAGQFLLFLCLYRLERLEEAKNVLTDVRNMQPEDERAYYNCILELVRLRLDGTSKNEISEILKVLYNDETVTAVTEQFFAEDALAFYPEMNCWDCDNCASSDICAYKEASALHRKLIDCALLNPISQEELLKRLRALCSLRQETIL